MVKHVDRYVGKRCDKCECMKAESVNVAIHQPTKCEFVLDKY